MKEESVSELEARALRFVGLVMQQVAASEVRGSVLPVRRIKEYIEAHYSQPELKLEQVAAALDMNLQYMCFLFKKQTDVTIGSYLLQTRMEAAKGLFQESCWNVSEVAAKVGFDDVSYFSKCFKKYFGVSPKEFRTKNVL